VGLVIVVIVIANLGGSDNGGTLVQADLAFADDISEIVTASGRIQPQTKVDIASEVSARIIKLYIAEGDYVTQGQRLLLLDTIRVKADLSQARFSLDEITARAEAARTQFEKNKLENQRQQSLFKQNLTSETAATNARFAFENSAANYDAAQAQVKTTRARLAKAEDNRSKTGITAPMDGVITYLSAEVGEIAQAQTSYTQGKTLMTIADLSVFEVEVDVDETEIAKVARGDSAKIRVDAFRDTVFSGTVVEIGNSASVRGQGTENYSTNFRVKVRFVEADPGIRPGMSASVDITTDAMEEAVLIPYASVVTRELDPDSLAATQDSSATETPDSDDLHAAVLQEGEDTAAAEDTTSDSTTVKKKKKDKVKKSGVFLVNNGIAEFVEVSTGIADNRNIVALTGVAVGDTVVSGSFQTLRRLSDGDKVRFDDRSIEKMEEGQE
jgi:HlyD family secretion protein